MHKLNFAICVLAIAGCQTAQPTISCENSDWFELGRQAGTSGQLSQSRGLRAQCAKNFSAQAETIYLSGYNRGLTEYCSPESGYAVGRSGQKPPLNCPNPLDEGFKLGFEKGRRAFELEQANQKIDRQISSISQQLQTSSPKANPDNLQTQLNGLKQQKEANARKIQDLEKPVN